MTYIVWFILSNVKSNIRSIHVQFMSHQCSSGVWWFVFFELLSVIIFTLAFIYIRSLTWGRLLLFFFIIVVNNFLQPFGNNIGHRCFSLNSISKSGRKKFDVENMGTLVNLWLQWCPDICNMVISGYAPCTSVLAFMFYQNMHRIFAQ